MKRRCLLIAAVPLSLVAGCAGLTGTQISSINSYSRLLEKNADIPGTIITEFIAIKYDIDLFNTGTVSADLANEKLWNSYRGKESALEKAKNADLSLKIMGEYAVGLARLSSDKLAGDIKKPSEKLGIAVDTLIDRFNRATGKSLPSGIGLLLSKGVVFVGHSLIRDEQAENLREYLQEGDTLIALATSELMKELDTLVLGQWVPALKGELKTQQEDLLKNLNPEGDYTAWYATQVNREAASLIARIDNLEKLAREAVRSAGVVRRAHRELLANVSEGKDIDEVLVETQELYRDTKDLYDTWRLITKSEK
ncbi:MAG: hypothetical protein ABSF80_05170 [Chitinispirillaceae bacterium]|jgi:hypothetical protein